MLPHSLQSGVGLDMLAFRQSWNWYWAIDLQGNVGCHDTVCAFA